MSLNPTIVLITTLLIICFQVAQTENRTPKDEQIQLKRTVASKCIAKYTTNCLLLDLCKLIDNLQHIRSFQILPGVYILTNKSEDTPMDIFEQVVTHNQSDKMDVYARKKTQAYLDSLSVSWKIMDRNSAFSVRQLSDNLITQLLPTPNSARKKKDKDSAIWTAGALAALGTSALFALTGKAAVASLAALLLSMICYFRGGSGHSSYTASGASYVTPYKHQCTEAIIDVNGRGDHSNSLIGYKKRTAEDGWNYPRYASSSTESMPATYRENENMNTYSRLFTVNAK